MKRLVMIPLPSDEQGWPHELHVYYDGLVSEAGADLVVETPPDDQFARDYVEAIRVVQDASQAARHEAYAYERSEVPGDRERAVRRHRDADELHTLAVRLHAAAAGLDE